MKLFDSSDRVVLWGCAAAVAFLLVCHWAGWLA
jgi:hypothetical protein